MKLANKITLCRIALIPVFVTAVLIKTPFMQYTALFIFLIAALTDTLDGYVARKYQQITDFGKFLDPLADKLLVTAALTALVDAGKISAWAMYIIVLREFAVTGLRLIAVNRGKVIPAGIWGKVKTVVQIIAVSVALLPLDLGDVVIKGYTLSRVVVDIMIVITVVSGVDYIVRNRFLLNDSK